MKKYYIAHLKHFNIVTFLKFNILFNKSYFLKCFLNKKNGTIKNFFNAF